MEEKKSSNFILLRIVLSRKTSNSFLKMNTKGLSVGIRGAEFINSSTMFVHLDNDRTFIIPFDKFNPIKELSTAEKRILKLLMINTCLFLQ